MDHDLERLRELITNPREDLGIEIKGWLNLKTPEHQADLGKALIALANHGGGYVLLGFLQGTEGYYEQQPRPNSFFNIQDEVNEVVHKFAEPEFHCHVELVSREGSLDLFPIVIVPGGHKVPIRAKREGPNGKHPKQYAYYIRRPGPKSEEPKSGQEWDELIGRCIRASKDDLLENFRNIMFGVNLQVPSKENQKKEEFDKWLTSSFNKWESRREDSINGDNRYKHGFYTVGYAVLDECQSITLSQLKEVLEKAQGHETGWPAWIVPKKIEGPYTDNGAISCMLSSSDFWRASPKGMTYMLRGYTEDRNIDFEPGEFIDVISPIWYVGECLLHARRFASEMCDADDSTEILISVTFEGLKNRELRSAYSRRTMFNEPVCKQDSVTSELIISVGQIKNSLPEVVQKLTAPIYEVFDFYSVQLFVFVEELDRLMNKRY